MQNSDSIEILKELIRINTTNEPGNEKPAAEYLDDLLTEFGFRCQIQDLGNNRANLIAELGNEDGPELMLNGHLDVVPAVGNWETDPFEALVCDGCIYGRGAADMKGGIAAMCEAAIRIAKKGGPGKGKLKLLFVADEECSNLGTLSYLREFPPSDYAIIGEPTDLKVAIAHRGVSRDYIDLLGAARHAALPEGEEEDAISKAARTIQAIHEINRDMQSRTHEVLPPPSVAVTMLHGYEKDNVIPGTVRLLLDFRILPGMSQQEVWSILDEGFYKAGITGYEKVPHFYMPGGETASTDEFVQRCLNVKRRMYGVIEEYTPCAFDASCEQCFLVEHGIKTIICGPGNISQAHTVGEYISEQQVRDAVDFYESIVEEVLGFIE